MSLTKDARVCYRSCASHEMSVADLHFRGGVACDTVNKDVRGQWVEACRARLCTSPLYTLNLTKSQHSSNQFVENNVEICGTGCLTDRPPIIFWICHKLAETSRPSSSCILRSYIIVYSEFLQFFFSTTVVMEPPVTSGKPNCIQLNTFHCHCVQLAIEHNYVALHCAFGHPGP